MGCGISFESSWWAHFHGTAKTYAYWVWHSLHIGELWFQYTNIALRSLHFLFFLQLSKWGLITTWIFNQVSSIHCPSLVVQCHWWGFWFDKSDAELHFQLGVTAFSAVGFQIPWDKDRRLFPRTHVARWGLKIEGSLITFPEKSPIYVNWLKV